MSTNNYIEWWRCERKNLEKSIKRHRPNSHKRTTMCEVNKLLFLYSHSEMKSYAKKHFFSVLYRNSSAFSWCISINIFIYLYFMRPPFLLFAVHVHSKNKKLPCLYYLLLSVLCMYMFFGACSIITAGVAKLMNNDS